MAEVEGPITGEGDGGGRVAAGGGRVCLKAPSDRIEAIRWGAGGCQQGPQLLEVQVAFCQVGPGPLALLQIPEFVGWQQAQVAGGQAEALVAGQGP